jgi:GH43 family beta-xylosidase
MALTASCTEAPGVPDASTNGGGSATGGGSAGGGSTDGGSTGGGATGGGGPTGGGATGGGSADAGPSCTTRITYGSSWIHPAGHPNDFDTVSSLVTWDGACPTDDAGTLQATLSNGWKPSFSGASSCIIALDSTASCTPAPAACATRITYGSAWLPPANHPNAYDDVSGVITWDGICHASGAQSWAQLSNGWTPYFNGSNACDLSLRHTQCSGLYANPVIATDCPDPGVLADNGTYTLVCTSGAPVFPIRTSTDLVHWTSAGAIFSAANKPTWANTDFWAPEIHRIGSHYVAYFSARNTADNALSIGAAYADNPLGPYTDLGAPLLRDPNPGVIDAHEYTAPDGGAFLVWKVDGNSIGQPTPIKIQPLAADGLSLTGTPTTLFAETQAWEGALVEGPWMIDFDGGTYLFYSANAYASAAYAIGVASAPSPTGPFTKGSGPILVSKGDWAGPGHGSVLRGPSGDWVHVFHAWTAAHIGQAPGREVLVERIDWSTGAPRMLASPSSRSQPLP